MTNYNLYRALMREKKKIIVEIERLKKERAEKISELFDLIGPEKFKDIGEGK